MPRSFVRALSFGTSGLMPHAFDKMIIKDKAVQIVNIGSVYSKAASAIVVSSV